MRSERELLDRAYMLVGHALPAALQTEIKTALGITPPVVADDVVKLLTLAHRTMWIALCWNDHNFDACHKYAEADTEGAGFMDIAQANAWLTKMEAALSVDVGAIEAERDKAKADLHFYACKVDELTAERNALQARIYGGTRTTAKRKAGTTIIVAATSETIATNATLILDDGVQL